MRHSASMSFNVQRSEQMTTITQKTILNVFSWENDYDILI